VSCPALIAQYNNPHGAAPKQNRQAGRVRHQQKLIVWARVKSESKSIQQLRVVVVVFVASEPESDNKRVALCVVRTIVVARMQFIVNVLVCLSIPSRP